MAATPTGTRWLALVLLRMGELMIVLDTTIVNVALPSIRADLGFTATSLVGIGAGMTVNPVLLAATGEVEQSDAGLASGIVNTSFMMGGALGLAVLASVASSRTEAFITAGETHAGALVGGSTQRSSSARDSLPLLHC